jgi:sporulation protein YlmC with PRC-barrel domain
MAKMSPKELLGREVYGADGSILGAIRAISWKESNLYDGKVIIGSREIMLLALIQDLALEGERLILKRSTREWLAEYNPLYR